MKGWIVDKDTGAPMAWVTEGDKPALLAAGHPFIPKAMPGRNQTFEPDDDSYIWDFASQDWVPGSNQPRDEGIAKRAEKAAAEQKRADAIARLKTGSGPPSRNDINDLLEAID